MLADDVFLAELVQFLITGEAHPAGKLERRPSLERHIRQNCHQLEPGSELWIDEQVVPADPAQPRQKADLFVRNVYFLISPIDDLRGGDGQGLESEPLWLLDFPEVNREFYDREYPERPGILIDMDLIYPEGYGEALSGGEREFEYEKIKSRIERKGIDLKAYEIYLQFAQRGLFPSTGFGIGIERLTRYICGIQQIAETRLFAKLPGVLGL